LQALYKKLRYDDDAEPQDYDADDDDEEAEFLDLRKRLIAFQDSIAAIDPDLYSSSLHALVTSTFRLVESGSSANWRDAEVALLELHSFAEPLRGN
jgi:exportin-T